MMQTPLKWDISPHSPLKLKNIHTLLTQEGQSDLSWGFRSSDHSLLSTWPKPPFPCALRAAKTILQNKREESEAQEWQRPEDTQSLRERLRECLSGSCGLSAFCFLFHIPSSGLWAFCADPFPVLLLCCWEKANIKVKYKYIYWH